MNFKELQDELVERADDPGISIESRKRWINDAYHWLQSKADWLWMRATWTDTTVADQQEYDLPNDGDRPNWERIFEVRVGGQRYNTRIEYEDRDLCTDSAFYLKDESTYGLTPTPAVAGTEISIFHKMRQVSLDDDDDEPAFSPTYHEILIEGALERYWRREGNYAKAREHQANAADILVQMVANKTTPVAKEVRRSRHIRELYGD